MYKVVGYYDDIYPTLLRELETLEGARIVKEYAYKYYNIVRIFYNGEEVE